MLRSLDITTTCHGLTNVFLNLFTGDTSAGGNVKRLKLKPDVHELSPCLATAITFGTIQSTWISHNVIVYNPEFDLLLISYLGWTRKALLILWIVEHYKIFPIKRESMQDHQQYSCCYHSFAKQFQSLPKGPYQYVVHKAHFRTSNES